MDWFFLLLLLLLLMKDHEMSSISKTKLKKSRSGKAILANIESIKHKKLLKLDRERKASLRFHDHLMKSKTSFGANRQSSIAMSTKIDASKPDVKEIFGGLFQRWNQQHFTPTGTMNTNRFNFTVTKNTLRPFHNSPSTKWPFKSNDTYLKPSNRAWYRYFQLAQNNGYNVEHSNQNMNNYNWYYPYWRQNYENKKTSLVNSYYQATRVPSNRRSRLNVEYNNKLSLPRTLEMNTQGIGSAKQPMESIGAPKQPTLGIGIAKKPEAMSNKQKKIHTAILRDCLKGNKTCINKTLNPINNKGKIFWNFTKNRKYSKYLDSFFKHVSKITHDQKFWKNAVGRDTTTYGRDLPSNDSVGSELLCKTNATCNIMTKYKTINGSRKDILLGVDEEDINGNFNENPGYEDLPLGPLMNLAPSTNQFSPFSKFPSFEDTSIITPAINGHLKQAADLPVPVISTDSAQNNKTNNLGIRDDILVGKLMPVSPEESARHQAPNHDEVLVGKIINIPTVTQAAPVHDPSHYDTFDVHANPFTTDVNLQPEVINKVFVHNHNHASLDPADLLPFAPTHSEYGHSRPVPIENDYGNSMHHFHDYGNSMQHFSSSRTESQHLNGPYLHHQEEYMPTSDHYSLHQLEPVHHQLYHQEMMVPGPLHHDPMPHPYTEPEVLVESDDHPEPESEGGIQSRPQGCSETESRPEGSETESRPQGCSEQKDEVKEDTSTTNNHDPYASISPENVYTSNLSVKDNPHAIQTDATTESNQKVDTNQKVDSPVNNDVYADLKAHVQTKPSNNTTKNQTAEDINHVKNIFREISSSDNDTAFIKRTKENATTLLGPKTNITSNDSMKHDIHGESNTSEVFMGEPKHLYGNESGNQTSMQNGSSNNELSNDSEKDGIMENIQNFLQKVATEKKSESSLEGVDNIPEKPVIFDERNEARNTSQLIVHDDELKQNQSAGGLQNGTNNNAIVKNISSMGANETTATSNETSQGRKNQTSLTNSSSTSDDHQPFTVTNSSEPSVNTNEKKIDHDTIQTLLLHFAKLKQRILDTMKERDIEDNTGTSRTADSPAQKSYAEVGTTDTNKILAGNNGEFTETHAVTDEPMKNGLIKDFDLTEYQKKFFNDKKSSEEAYSDIGSSEKQQSVDGTNETKGFIKNIAEDEKRTKTKRRKISKRKNYSKSHRRGKKHTRRTSMIIHD